MQSKKLKMGIGESFQPQNSSGLIYHFFLAIFLFIGTSWQLAVATEPIGTVAIIRGEAFLKVGNVTSKVIPNSVIREKDLIEVSERGFVKVLMKDDSIITINENSKLSFDNFKIKSKEDRKVDYNLKIGKVRALITKKLGTGHINLKTKAVTMGVRGTDFLANAFERKGKIETDVLVVSGKVNVNLSNLKLPKMNDVDLTPGKFLSSVTVKEVGGEEAVREIPAQTLSDLRANPDAFIPESVSREGDSGSPDKGSGSSGSGESKKDSDNKGNSNSRGNDVKKSAVSKNLEKNIIQAAPETKTENILKNTESINKSVDKITEKVIQTTVEKTQQSVQNLDPVIDRLNQATGDADDETKSIINELLQNK
jgi:hypothetical protein